MLKPHAFLRTALLEGILAASLTPGFTQAAEKPVDKSLYDRLGVTIQVQDIVRW